jgi:photosystem II stability/assembly factor-like uncharacterized protein
MVTAQSPAGLDGSLLEGLQYRCIGPHRGGRVTAVEGIPSRPFTFLMGSTGGGVWKTTDAGISWQNISDKYFEAGSIGAIAVAPSDPNVIYVGTGSADPRGNVSAGCGLYRSTDGGETWRHIGLRSAGQVARIVVHPQKPALLYAAVLGNVFGPSPERGVYRSTDGGNTWQKQLFISDRTGAIELVMDPNNPRILYAGMWTAERKPWTIVDGSEEGGVWKSTDEGDTWTLLTNGLPTGLVGRIGMAVSPQNSKRIWVLQEAKEETRGGLYVSEDGGESWERINRKHDYRQRAWYYSRIYADPQDEYTLYLCNVGFYKSIDGGLNFTRTRTPHSDNHALWINPDNPNIMIQANDGGANVSLNGGKTWSTQYNQPTAEFYRVTVDNQFPYRVYGAQQDNSAISVPSRSEADLVPEQYWHSVGGGESGYIAVDPRNPNLIYAGNYIGQITRREHDRGHQRNIVAYPQMHDGTAPRDIVYRFQWNAPIRISPHNPDVVYHCSQFVHRSEDGGRNWEVISPDLTTDKDAYQDIPGGPIQHDHTGVELYTTIFAFEESPLRAGELWAGSDDGLVHLSRDGGKNWENITPKQMPAEGTVNTIELSAHGAGRAFLAVYKYRENDFRPYIFMTNDYGKNWRLLTTGQNGIPGRHFVRVVREDPFRKGLLYAGTEFGMYVSFDEGKNWQSFQLNLPATPISDMIVKNKDLVVATQGRSFWILDDLSPLHETNAAAWKQSPFLFAPGEAYRTQLRNFRGQAAPDPAPLGALIYFYLDRETALGRTVRLSIIDPGGRVRRVFSSNPNPAGKEEKLTIKSGLNRFEWDLKYEALDKQPGSVFSLANTGGIRAPTGEHRVRLETDGQMQEQPLVLSKDPRWRQSDADLKAQYELSMQIKALFDRCHTAIGGLRSVRTQLESLKKYRQDKDYGDAIAEWTDKITGKLNDLEKELIQTQSESGQDPINYPSQIDDQIAYLYSVVNAQDDRPNSGAYQRYQDLKASLQPKLDRLESILAEEVKSLNEFLKERMISLISVE